MINDAEGGLYFILTNIYFQYGFNCIVFPPPRRCLYSPLYLLSLLTTPTPSYYHVLSIFVLLSSLLPVCSVIQLTCYCYHKGLCVSPGLLWPILCHFYSIPPRSSYPQVFYHTCHNQGNELLHNIQLSMHSVYDVFGVFFSPSCSHKAFAFLFF